MQLTESKFKELQQKLQSKTTHPPCPMCGRLNFLLNDHQFHLLSYNQIDPTTIAEFTYNPVILITCTHCGHMLMFNQLYLEDSVK